MTSKQYLLMLTTAITFCQLPAWAAEADTPSPPPVQQQDIMTLPTNSLEPDSEGITVPPVGATEEPDKPDESPGLVDQMHVGLSNGLLSTAAWLDSFFGDERYVAEENRSYLRALYNAFQEERSKLLLRPTVDLRLVLPQLEKKAHIVFSAEPTESPKDTKTPVTVSGEQAATTEDRNFTAALEYFIRSVPRETFIIRTGGQISEGQPVLFASPRYRSLVPLDPWDFRFTQEATYRTDTAWQTYTRFDLERELPGDLFFRASINGAWYENRVGYFPNLVFSLRQKIDASHAVDYEWVNNYQTRPITELTEVALRLRYRHSFWRRWLFGEVAPQIRFPREMNFEGIPGILFRLEMFFGK
ncbi:MAG: hypothetical protein HY786_04605 [Deltaproteobacteria bacterium]|nr:hypothetical protein [Deltaproteobacteria bacterium]